MPPHSRCRVELDLSEFQGQTIELELAVDPGPQHSPTYDWARWRRPRIEQRMRNRQTIVVDTADSWQLALNGDGAVPLTQTGHVLSVETIVPGAVAFLREQPAGSDVAGRFVQNARSDLLRP